MRPTREGDWLQCLYQNQTIGWLMWSKIIDGGILTQLPMLQPCKIRSCHNLLGTLSCSYGLRCKWYSVRPPTSFLHGNGIMAKSTIAPGHDVICLCPSFSSHCNGILAKSTIAPGLDVICLCFRLVWALKIALSAQVNSMKGVNLATNQENSPF